MKNYEVVEYSKSQDCFHKHSLFDAVKYNQKSILQNTRHDFLIVAVFDIPGEADRWIKKNRGKFQKDDKLK